MFHQRKTSAVFAFSMMVFWGTCLTAQEDPVYYDRAPYLQSLTETSVIIVSQTENESIAELHVSGPAFDRQWREMGAVRDHAFHLHDLQPDSVYTYTLTYHNTQMTYTASFRTLPPRDAPITVAVFGDCGNRVAPGEEFKIEDQKKIAALLNAFDPPLPLILQAGDVVTPGTLFHMVQYAFFDIYEDLLMKTCIYPAFGNHDNYYSDLFQDNNYICAWESQFHTPANNPALDKKYYSFDAGAAHIAVVNTESMKDAQLTWLARDLSQTNRPWTILLLHRPPFGTTLHPGNRDVREKIMPIADAFHVDLVLTGHNHVYERFHPVFQNKIRGQEQEPDYHWPGGTIVVTTGGGGAPLYYRGINPILIHSPDLDLSAKYTSVHHFLTLTITPALVEVTAIDAEGETFDRFRLHKSSPKPAAPFIRGDANEDGSINLSDPVTILEHIFGQDRSSPPPCLAACDVNNSGRINLADPIMLLTYLFSSGADPEAPFPDCGTVEGANDVGCGRCGDDL